MNDLFSILKSITRQSQLCVAAALGFTLLPLASHAKPIRASTDPVKDETPLTEADHSHWAFRPLLHPQPPQVKAADRVVNEVDRFILAPLESRQLSLAAPASSLTLLRRVTMDLTGLPPSPEDACAFMTACQQETGDAQKVGAKAYEEVVDRLLASERHGEAWAQYWLDLARFAETDGFEHDKERSSAWKYRDWVIKAMNDDLPFDEFVANQIAGDELPEGSAVATGFLLAGPDMPDTNFQDERMHLLLNGITGTVGSAFLGLTMGCAQCHDHPYDPVSQADFYRLRACFDNLPKLKRDKQLDATYMEAGTDMPVSRVCIKGDHQRPGPTVKAAFPRIANPIGMEVYPERSRSSTGRRAALARWLTQPSNYLFLRTTANRLWMQHFGVPIAGSPNDLGIQGQDPTHPELLDWLASELPRRQWSMKAMHKLLVMSATYRQASEEEYLRAGGKVGAPVTDYLHFPLRRLTGEQLRDAMLMVSGRLNLKKGGESVRLPLPPEVSQTLLKKQISVTEDATQHDRRSIYVFARRNLRYPMFDLFDRPDALLSCGRRTQSTTAPQSLLLFNSDVSWSLSQSLAQLVTTVVGTESDAVVQAAIWRCYSRPATEQEITQGRHFLESQTALTKTLEEATTDYCLALLNSSAFCYVD